jgi:hypothetical protein
VRFYPVTFADTSSSQLPTGYLFGALSYFSWICWIKPSALPSPKYPSFFLSLSNPNLTDTVVPCADNIVVNQLFGSSTGLGLGLFSFDWSQISWIGSPLITPWWAQVNLIVGVAFCYWVIVPAMYYTNVRLRHNLIYLPSRR